MSVPRETVGVRVSDRRGHERQGVDRHTPGELRSRRAREEAVEKLPTFREDDQGAASHPLLVPFAGVTFRRSFLRTRYIFVGPAGDSHPGLQLPRFIIWQ